MRILALFLFLFVNGLLFSQEKVNWMAHYNENSKNIEIVAEILEGWHLYSQNINPEIGPIPTQFKFDKNDSIVLIGKTIEPTSIKKFDENFEATLDFFEGKTVFTQKIELKASTKLELSVTFMVCNETMCLPPIEKIISIELNK
jgi:hypothetical protein